MSADAVSLAWELEEIGYAIDGARLLCSLAAHEQAATEHDRQTAPRAAAAMLSLVACRLRLLRSVAGGELDPDIVRAPHNEVAPVDADERKEALLYWTEERRARFVRRELRRIKARLEAQSR
jgi:hypothetical protein